MIASRLVAAFGVLVLAACSTGGDSANPVLRSLGWFSFLDGHDIRRDCRAGEPDRYRLVYNGRWGEQVRIYEILRPQRSGPAEMTTRVIFPETLSDLSTEDLLRPWRGREAGATLSLAEMAALDRALAASGFDEPSPAGLVLQSDGSYWVAMACRDGSFHYNAYAYPSARFAALRFPEVLLRHDGTQVAMLPPRRGYVDRYTYTGPDRPGPVAFDLEVGENGLKLVAPWF